jgi:methionyl-tRNA synthetase
VSDASTAPADHTFTVTTPIYYVNGRPHIGHAYTSVAADVLSRWNVAMGRGAFLLTGTDEHGQKVFEAANKRGISPAEHIEDMLVHWQALLPLMDVQNSDFIRTTEPRHVRVVQAVLQKLYDEGEIYADYYEGWYSTSAERFWTEKDLVDGKCPDTGQPVEWIKEKNYFFRMSKYADQLQAWIDDHPDFIRPVSRRNEVLGALKKGTGDLCITRPKSRMSWGIEIPFDTEYVTYVWFDALLNYITAIGYHPDPAQCSPRFHQHWPADFQLVGKDILTTHSIYWSTMLFALGLEPASCLYAHGWWTVKGGKMSKSIGNVLDPELLVRSYGVDAVRYFLLREIPFGGDGDFDHQGFLLRYNADLANDLGNLAHRSLTMTGKWLGGAVPELDESTELDRVLEQQAADSWARYAEAMDSAQFHQALQALWDLVGAANKYIDSTAPWALNKAGETARLGGVMRRCLEVCRVAAALLAPFCPNKAPELAGKLGYDGGAPWAALGSLDGLTAGTAVDAGQPLFPRLQELPEEIAAMVAPPEAPAPAPAPKPSKKKAKKAAPLPEGAIEFSDFQKVQIKVGTVTAAEAHPKADRLLVLTVDLGEPEPRTIVAGLAEVFSADQLLGQQVLVVANLAPRKLRGVMSQGMVLAIGGDEGILALASSSAAVPAGTVVR